MATNTDPRSTKPFVIDNHLQLSKVQPMTDSVARVLVLDAGGQVRFLGVDTLPKAGSKKLLLSGAIFNTIYNIDGSVAISIFNATSNGVVPASGGGSSNFLRSDGVWATAGMTNPMTSVGDLIQGDAGGNPVRLASIAAGNVLITGGVVTPNSWGKVTNNHVNNTVAITTSGQVFTGVNVFTSPRIETSMTTNGATLNLFTANVAGVTMFSAVTTFTMSGTSQAAVTATFFANATNSGVTKTINIGTNGLSGSITNISLGSATVGAVGTLTINNSTITSKFLTINASGNFGCTQLTQSSTNTFQSWAQAAHTGGSPVGLIYVQGAHTSLTASVESLAINLNTSATVQYAAGSLTRSANILLQAPSVAFVGASTLTDNATLTLTGAARSGANATTVNAHGLLILATASVNSATNTFGATINAQTGGTNNYAAQTVGGSFLFSAGTTTYPSAIIPSGTNLTTTQAGAIENDGTHLYFTFVNSGTRYQLDQQTSAFSNPMTSIGDLIQGDTGGAAIRLASIAAGNVLITGGVATLSSWGKVTDAHVNSTVAITTSGQVFTGVNVFTSPRIETSMTTNGATLNLFTANVAGVTMFSAVTTLTLSGTSQGTVNASFFANATNSGVTKSISVGTGGLSGSITNISLGSATAGALGTLTLNSSTISTKFLTVTATGGFSFTQTAQASGWTPQLNILPGAHTSMTTATEFVDYDFKTRTATWLAGTTATQRFAYFRGQTVAGASASAVFTDLYTVYIDPSIVGTNAFATNNWALGLGGGLKLFTGTTTQAALVLPNGVNLTTTKAGAFENDGTHLYFTFVNSGTRYQLDQQSGGASVGVTNEVQLSDGSGAFVAGGHTWATNTLTLGLSGNTSVLQTITTDGSPTGSPSTGLTITAKNSSTTGVDGGSISIIGGSASVGAGRGGTVSITGGDTIGNPGGASGTVIISGGSGVAGSTYAGSDVRINGGLLNQAGMSGAGFVRLTGGISTISGKQGGGVVIIGGNTSTGNGLGADVSLKGGQGIGTGGGGNVSLNAALGGATGTTGAIVITGAVATTGTPSLFVINTSAHTTITAIELKDVSFNLNRNVQFIGSTGFAIQRAAVTFAPTYSFVTATGTIVDAATSAISGAPAAGTNAALTNTHGLLIQSGAVGAQSVNSFGATINAQTGATNNYAGQTIGGNFLFSAATTTYASIRLPHGAAPTTPVNGDLWTTTVTAFGRFNGVTVDMITKPAGNVNQIQYYGAGGVFAASTALTWDSTVNSVFVINVANTFLTQVGGGVIFLQNVGSTEGIKIINTGIDKNLGATNFTVSCSTGADCIVTSSGVNANTRITSTGSGTGGTTYIYGAAGASTGLQVGASGAILLTGGTTVGSIQIQPGTGGGTVIIGNSNFFSISSVGSVGFFGATAAVQQPVATILVNNVTSGGALSTIANYTSLSVYSTDAATIRNNFFRLAEKVLKLETALRSYGLAIN